LAFLCGFFASCAAVETASKPIKAKNTTLHLAKYHPTIMTKIVATEEVKKRHLPELKVLHLH
jgi:hypothetical protein